MGRGMVRYIEINISHFRFHKSSLIYSKTYVNNCVIGTSLAGQRLRLRASNVRNAGLIPVWGTKVPHAAWCSQKIKINKNF